MKKPLLFLLFFSMSFGFLAQEEEEEMEFPSDYVLIENKDTIFCFITALGRAGGNVYLIEYINEKNETISIKKKEISKVKSFRIGGFVNDYIPLDPSKPNKYQRHIEVKVDGPIKIYDHIRLIAYVENGERKFYSVVGAGAKIYTIKLDNGEYYKLSEKNINNIISPYLKKCSEFKSEFIGEITIDVIEQAVMIYNKNCSGE